MFKELRIHCDGGARGNPGPAAIGVVIESIFEESTKMVAEFGRVIGVATNNVAEYTAVLNAFTYLYEQGIRAKKITVIFDSQLVARQLAGQYKIKKDHLRTLAMQVKTLEKKVGERVVYISVPRAENARADELLNNTLD